MRVMCGVLLLMGNFGAAELNATGADSGSLDLLQQLRFVFSWNSKACVELSSRYSECECIEPKENAKHCPVEEEIGLEYQILTWNPLQLGNAALAGIECFPTGDGGVDGIMGVLDLRRRTGSTGN